VKLWQEFWKGVIEENPIARMLLGMCPTLAVTTAAINGLGMGLATTAVLTASNAIISVMRGCIPKKIRIPVFIVVIASFVTMVDLTMAAYTPPLHKALGIFIPLIVVNCLILQRAEAYASRRPLLLSLVDGLGMGLGFTLSLTVLAGVREVLGAGTLFGCPVLGSVEPALLFILPPGAFIALGLLIGAVNWVERRAKASRQGNEVTARG